MPDKVVYGRLVLPEGVRDGGLLIHDEKIIGLTPNPSPQAERGDLVAPNSPFPSRPLHAQEMQSERGPGGEVNHIDYRGKYILPGLIEVHGHMREPGLSHKEDYPHGTSAAVAGGVTTIFDMPNTVPPTTTIERLREKEQIAAGRAYCDYAMIFGGARNNQDEIAKLDPREVVGVKFFMAGHETTPTTVTDLGDLYAGLRAMQGKNLVALFHAENQSLINRLSADMKAAGRDDGRAYSESRGPLVAVLAIRELLPIASSLGVSTYICHISTQAELNEIENAQLSEMEQYPIDVYLEAVGYHLTFQEEDYAQLDTLIKVSPPIRSIDEREALWEAIYLSRINTLASEHSPHTRTEKELEMFEAASGTPGIQENLPMLVTQYRERRSNRPLDEIIQAITRLGGTNVAHIFGIADRKGSLEVGKDADFTVLDTNQMWTIQESDLFSKCGWSAYTGRTATCKVVATYLRGEKVYEDGKIIGEPRGKLLRRS